MKKFRNWYLVLTVKGEGPLILLLLFSIAELPLLGSAAIEREPAPVPKPTAEEAAAQLLIAAPALSIEAPFEEGLLDTLCDAYLIML